MFKMMYLKFNFKYHKRGKIPIQPLGVFYNSAVLQQSLLDRFVAGCLGF